MTSVIGQSATQATEIERTRAATEVIASIEAAHRWPRDEDAALERFLRVCKIKAFADRSFWRYRVGGEMLTDVTISFALEAVRCWGNFISGSAELARRPGESEMLAYAWDLETNAIRRTIFVNPHTGYTDSPFDKEGNRKELRELIAVRDIRQNNQSAGSRVERQMILACLPEWFVELAKDTARETANSDDSGKPIELRRRELIAAFQDRYDIRRPVLVAKLGGVPVDQWNNADLAQLGLIGRAIEAGESSVAAEFAELMGSAPVSTLNGTDLAKATAAPDPAEPVDTDKPTRAALNGLMARFSELGLTGKSVEVRARRLRLAELLLPERTDPIGSANDLTADQVATLRERLAEESAETVTARLAEDQADRDGAYDDAYGDGEPPAEDPGQQP
jgi:hypothetical protein